MVRDAMQEPATAVTQSSEWKWRETWPVLLMLALAWWLAIRPQLNAWWWDPQYQYGLLVPLLCAVLFRRRCHDAPPAEALDKAERWLIAGGAVLCVIALAAMQPVYEANPGWWLTKWVPAPAAVGLTLCAIFLAGGRPWLRHFAFPVLFFLVAVPWPSTMAHTLMQELMQGTAATAVEALRWLGFEAVRRGNLIELSGGVLEIEEACSGVRSLQSGLMAALFLGEFYRLGGLSRAGLVMVAGGAALAGNVVRTLLLAIVASRNGLDAVHGWHDPAGLWVLLAVIGVVWGAASLLARSGHVRSRPVESTGEAKDLVRTPLVRFPQPVALSVIGFWLLAMVGTEAWFRAHERGLQASPVWSVRQPAPNGGFEPVALSTHIQSQLQFDKGSSGRWTDLEGLRWQYFYFRWEPGGNAVSMREHDPRGCLTGAGMIFESDLGSHVVETDGAPISFRVFRFRDGPLPVFVFHSFLEDGEDKWRQAGLWEDYSFRSRLRAVQWGRRSEGRRLIGQSLIEVAAWGTTDLAEAEAGLRDFLAAALVTNGRPAPDTANAAQPEAGALRVSTSAPR